MSARTPRLRLSDIRPLLPVRKRGAHKGDAGRVYIVAGSRGMAGAAALSTWGAVRAGAGLVRTGIVKSQQNVIARRAPLEATNDALPEDKQGRLPMSAVSALRKNFQRFKPDIVAAGPGLGVTPAIVRLVRFLVFENTVPVVLDADGLNALALLAPKKSRVPLVLTPHPGEMARLLNRPAGWVSSHRREAADAAAQRWGAVCLLKGADTIISNGRSAWQNTTGNPGMASGGMGDVLTGIIAAMWAQHSPRDRQTGFRAAVTGAYLHGLAADIAARSRPPGSLLASDVAAAFPVALKKARG